MDNKISFKLGFDMETVKIISGSQFAVVALVGKSAGKQVAGNGYFSESVIAEAVAFASNQIGKN